MVQPNLAVLYRLMPKVVIRNVSEVTITQIIVDMVIDTYGGKSLKPVLTC